MTFWQKFWHRLAGHAYQTDLMSERCAVCGTRQGDWVYFAEMP